ncbi:transcription termination/antitermination protein NusG [Propionimicrobium lymphophilum]|uniref:transcription termination/antitermination protein NusG n=1 Tax=Propionimicrobium lymphophilum TaxID=33012 RepID=UPI000425394F|nr:transcription termination/antitermination protein NusG [Propionimicrobium lymphophilum]
MTQTPNEDQDFLEDGQLAGEVNEETGEVDIDLSALGLGEEEPETTEEVEINLNFDADEEEETPSEPEINLDALSEDEESEEDEDADDTEQALERELVALEDELRTKPGDWYVVHTYSGMENRVKQNIEARIVNFNLEDEVYEVIVPTEETVEVRNGQRKNVTRTFMPGYVLVRMDMTDEAWQVVRHTPSVTGIVGYENQPVPLSIDEVMNMLKPLVVSKVAAETNARAKKVDKIVVADYKAGDSVMVTDGPFAGVHATIVEINAHNQRVRANVEILGRETPVDLTFEQIQKVI